MTTLPSVVRMLVMRSVTSSTVPVRVRVTPVTESWMRSPKPYCRSVIRKKPARMSWTMRCAPKPRATPATAAGATMPLRGRPSRPRTVTAAMP
jgi:hypothetical protein